MDEFACCGLLVGAAVLALSLAALGVAMRARARADELEQKLRRLTLDFARWQTHGRGPGAGPTTAPPSASPPQAASAPGAAPTPAAGAAVSPAPIGTAGPTYLNALLQDKAAFRPQQPAREPATTADSPDADEVGPLIELTPLDDEIEATPTPAEGALRARLGQVRGPDSVSAEGVALEQRFGGRIAAWLGAIALFLAGAYLVKYTFDQGLLGPTTRIVLGTIFGLTMIAAGEWLRTRSANVAQGLTAAGVADLFACFLAATKLYHLVGDTTGFVLLVATTALAIVLSLRQGQFVALLGLVGGFITPALIGSTEPRPGFLFSYLLLLEIGLLVVTRRRAWWPLMALTMAGSFGWAALWMAQLKPADTAVLAPFLMASIVAVLASTWRRSTDSKDARDLNSVVAGVGAAVLGVALLAGMTHSAGYQPLDWAFLGILGAGAIALGWWDGRYRALAAFTGALSAVLLVSWACEKSHFDEARFALTLAALAGVYAVGGYATVWRSAAPLHWISISSLAGIAYLLLAYWCTRDFAPFGAPWWCVAIALALLYALAATPIYRLRARLPRGNLVFALPAIAVSAFVSCAIPMECERDWFAVAWALEVLALVVIAGWLRTPELHVPAAVLTIAVVAMLFQSDVLRYEMGATPVWNWILYGYGVPAAALAAAAWLLARQNAKPLSEAMCAAAALVAFGLVTLETRHFFHPENLGAGRIGIHEETTYICVWALLAIGWLLRERVAESEALLTAARVVAGLAALCASLALCVVLNPIHARTTLLATPVLNDLLYLYGAPALLLALVARLFRFARRMVGAPVDPAPGGGDPSYKPSVRRRPKIGDHTFHHGVALLLLFMLVTLEVRQGFHGAHLDGPAPSPAEMYTYSAAWIGLGFALLGAAILTGATMLRWSSLLVMLLAVGKVFLYDTANLRDLYRVFSLLGLGLSLMLLAWIYQRFVFRAPPRAG